MNEAAKLIEDNYRTLTREEEVAAWESGDCEALVNSQLKAVYAVAVKVVKQCGRTDLMDEAFSIGLMELARLVRNNFDPSRGRLVTLVMWCLRNRIFSGLQTFRDTGGIRKLKSIGKTGKRQLTGVEVTTMERPQYREALQITDRHSSSREWCTDLMDLIDSANLSKRERFVLDQLLDGRQLSEIGVYLGVTKSRVDQIRASVRKKLRYYEKPRSER